MLLLRNSKTFLKTTERTKIKKKKDETTKINPPEDFISSEPKINITKVVPLYQKALSKIFNCSDCNREVIPDQDDLDNCPCGLTATIELRIANDKIVIIVKNKKLLWLNLVTT